MAFNKKIFSAFFESGAITVCPADKPCFYSPTRLGAYVVQPYSLCCRSDAEIAALTALVRTAADTPALCVRTLADYCDETTEKNPVYGEITEESARLIEQTSSIDGIDFICGSTRASWLQSIPLARHFSKPHLLLTADGVIANNARLGRSQDELNGANILFISDLIGRGNIFYKTLFPSVTGRGGKIAGCHSILDCLSGGSDRLHTDGIPCSSIFELDKGFFSKAAEMGYIDAPQLAAVFAFIDDPIKAMADFCSKNTDYMKKEYRNAIPANSP